MSKYFNHHELNQGDNTDTNLSLTFTQIASCVVGAEFIEHRRQSLRAKLERELYERKNFNSSHSPTPSATCSAWSETRTEQLPKTLIPDKTAANARPA